MPNSDKHATPSLMPASTTAPTPATSSAPMTAGHRKVILAASLGALFEWYDFYLYGALAAVLGARFFSTLGSGSAFVLVLLAFAAGFVVRPLGALMFGRLGDLIGRKYTFLVTLLLMGVATFLVGVLPGADSIGVAAPVALVLLRLLQGLAIGGEYGGVVTYVAEHAPEGRRGYYTGWIQTTATLGLLLALLVIVGVRALLGDAAFADWGWRLPFLLSAVLIVIGVWVRLSLHESPPFRRIKQAGRSSRRPLAEAFGQWGNARLVLLALFGLVAGQAVVWYTGQFQALYFLTRQLHVDETTASLLAGTALALGAPLIVAFAALSDRVGRKPIIVAGFVLAASSFFPLFAALAEAANPALAKARASVAVTLTTDPGDCSVALNAIGAARALSACDIAKQVLAERSVRYLMAAPAELAGAATGTESSEVQSAGGSAGASAGAGAGASANSALTATNRAVQVVIDGRAVAAPREDANAPDDSRRAWRETLGAALSAAGYPSQANPAQINQPLVVAILWLLMVFVAMVYGPIAAMLVEMFPTRLRCTSVSLPYHLGNGWFGGLLPATSFAIAAQTGDMFDGLWYPVGIALLSATVALLWVQETKDRDIYAGD